jgi:hypothetical protein
MFGMLNDWVDESAEQPDHMDTINFSGVRGHLHDAAETT